MKSVKEEFPNPVLAYGRDDYNENCSFCTFFDEEKISEDDKNFNIPITYSLECKGLTDLIKKKEAVCVVLVRSSAASYSKLFKFDTDKTEMVISIPKYDVVNKINLTGSIIAAKDIPKFRCEGEFNELYFGKSAFIIRKGDILAVEEGKSIPLDDSELEKPLPSIFDIYRENNQDSDIVPWFEGDKIEIHLKDELYELYYNFKGVNKGLLNRPAMGIIVYPVLVEAISYIKSYYQNNENTEYSKNDEISDMDELRWFRTIVKKAKSEGVIFKDETNTAIADKLLKGVVLDSLKSLKYTFESEIDSGDSQILEGI